MDYIDVITRKNEHMFYHAVAVELDNDSVFHFKDMSRAILFIEEYNDSMTIDGLDGAAAVNKLKETLTDSFFRDFGRKFAGIKRPITASKKSKIVSVEMLGSAADLIHKYCKENECDPSMAIAAAFSKDFPKTCDTPRIYEQDQVIAGAVADMLDKKFGKRMAEIEMTMGLISDSADAGSMF